MQHRLPFRLWSTIQPLGSENRAIASFHCRANASFYCRSNASFHYPTNLSLHYRPNAYFYYRPNASLHYRSTASCRNKPNASFLYRGHSIDGHLLCCTVIDLENRCRGSPRIIVNSYLLCQSKPCMLQNFYFRTSFASFDYSSAVNISCLSLGDDTQYRCTHQGRCGACVEALLAGREAREVRKRQPPNTSISNKDNSEQTDE